MNLYIKRLMLLAGCSVILTVAHSQDLSSIKAGFEQYSKNTLQEKIFAHTDKSFYMTGEILWFKLYNVDAGLNTLLSVSKVAYVDVLDNDNNTIMQAKVSLKDGMGNGSLYIPVTLNNGNYKLRAYTSWMKNFSPELYFEKQITIVNPLKTPDEPVKKIRSDYDIQFFPEGGTLVNGLTSTVGFKVTGEDGKGVHLSGVVINEHNDTVARFGESKLGMGRFTFTPVANNSYKAIMRIGTNNSLIKDLPAIAAQGYVMHVDDDGNGSRQVQIKISASSGINGALYLLAHSGQKVTAAQLISLGANNNATITINKDKLGEGINHFTLFNSNRQPVCERLYFKRPVPLNLQANVQQQYGLRKKVAVDIAATGRDGSPQKANLSVAVVHLDSLNSRSDADIESYLWLTSELKGNIETPGYYFTNVTQNTDDALDNLLLTQGWSRYKWSDALAVKPASFRFLPEYNGHIITGKITDEAGAPVKNKVTYLGVISKKVQLYGSNSDSTGRLLFNTRDLYGANEIVLQTNTEQDSSISHITINSPFSEQYSTTKLPPFYLNNKFSTQLESTSLGMQVQNLYKPENLRQFYSPGVDSAAFYYNHYKAYLLDNFTRFTTMEEVLREYIFEVNIVKQRQRFHIKVISKDGPFLDNDPMVLLDGIPIFNIDKVFTLDPLKMKRLEVLNQRYYWGPIISDGILSYTSYKGDLGGYELDPRAVVLDYEGIQLQREFYSPVYDTEQQQQSRIPDFRNVLYWTPDLNTGDNGKAQATFYTSDQAGKYIGIVQGIAANGQAGSKYFIFNVGNSSQ